MAIGQRHPHAALRRHLRHHCGKVSIVHAAADAAKKGQELLHAHKLVVTGLEIPAGAECGGGRLRERTGAARSARPGHCCMALALHAPSCARMRAHARPRLHAAAPRGAAADCHPPRPSAPAQENARMLDADQCTPSPCGAFGCCAAHLNIALRSACVRVSPPWLLAYACMRTDGGMHAHQFAGRLRSCTLDVGRRSSGASTRRARRRPERVCTLPCASRTRRGRGARARACTCSARSDMLPVPVRSMMRNTFSSLAWRWRGSPVSESWSGARVAASVHAAARGSSAGRHGDRPRVVSRSGRRMSARNGRATAPARSLACCRGTCAARSPRQPAGASA